jgi:uncharacterized phage protein (TIGR02218 family)
MSRALPGALVTAIQSEVTTLVKLVTITRLDGTILRMTDAALDVIVNDDLYRSDIGFTISDMVFGLNLNNTQGVTLQVAMSEDGISRTDLRTRKYYGATIVVSACDFTQPDTTVSPLGRGIVGRVYFTETGLVNIELQSQGSDLEQFADEQYSQTCRASLGDSRCGFPIETFRVDFTVTEVLDASSFIVDTFGQTAAAYPTESYFGFGQLKWTGGDNLNWEMDVIKSDFSTKTLTLFYPTPEVIQVGDTGKVYPGCDRQHSTCAGKFANTDNFRGEPYAPQWSLN